MLVYRTLTEDDFPRIFDTFIRAFADYEIPARPAPEDLRRMLTRRGARYELSVGVFDGDVMAAVMMVGLGTWQGEAATYDVTTGVTPEYRGRGIATGMIDWIRPAMLKRGSRRMLLEVLQNNAPAIKAYRRAGFREVRELICFHVELSEFRRPRTHSGVRVAQVGAPDWDAWRAFDTREASWQNSIESTCRGLEPTTYFQALDGDSCVGYATCSRVSRDLFGLAVSPGRRRKGIGSALMGAVIDHQEKGPLRVMNVDARADEDLAFYQAIGATELVRQFEMELDLTRDD